MTKRLCGSVLFVLVMVAGCDVTDAGEWARITPPVPASSELAISGSMSIVQPPITPTGEVTTRVPFVVCQIPPAATLSIDPDLASWYLGDRNHVCVGEPGEHGGLKVCWGVEAAAAHAQGVADCFIAMKQELARQGTKILGGSWWDAAQPMLPDAWSLTERQALDLVDRVSNNIADLLGGGKVPADPLCIYRPRHADPAQLKTDLLTKIAGYCQADGDEVQAILSAIKRGVNVQVTTDLKLELAAMIVEKNSPTQDVAQLYHCTFGK
jgi:hypothetical protein